MPDVQRVGSGPVLRTAVVKLTAAWILMPLIFLATGGSLRWWAAWGYCLALLVPATGFMIYMARRDPEFILRRSKMRETQNTQQWIVRWALPLVVSILAVPGLDHRFGWSAVPTPLVLAGLALTVLGYVAIIWVFLNNRWAGRTIETYDDQQVVSTGPYAVVRHPMYAAATLLYLATPLALGSWWAMPPAVGLVAMFVFRIRNEEELLVRDLRGYDDYRRRVRYRLLPGVW